MQNNKSSYREIFRNTTIFGGVQVFNVLISVIKGKFVAVLLGPTGLGVISLLNSPLSLISTITGLGLSFSAVRNISDANSTNDRKRISRTIVTVRRWFILSGFTGSAATLILAPQLSEWSFGNSNYTWSFGWLSVTLFLSAISTGQSTLLQGLRRISDIVRSSLIGSLLGLFTSIPLYYYYGISGIVPSIILSAIITLILTWYFTRRIKFEPVKVSLNQGYLEGIDMAKMGAMLMISLFLGSFTKYGINIAVGKIGSVQDVGLYAAAISISSQYIGFLLTSISTDFFPRLVAVQKDVIKTNQIVNQQSEIIILVSAPLLIFMIITAPMLVKLFLSAKFLVISDFIRFVSIGSFFQATSYCMGYISFAKNDKRSYFLLEGVFGNLLQFSFSLIFYYLWGLQGLGISFLFIYLTYFITISGFTRLKYKYVISKNTLKLFFVMLTFLSASLGILILLPNLLGHVITSILFVFSIIFAIRELDQLLDLKSLINNLKYKLLKKDRNYQ